MKIAALATLLTGLSLAQHVQVPSDCTGGFQPGRSVVIYTTPYTFSQVMGIIGSYKNLTWSGNPDNTVTLNGTDNKVDTARSYQIPGSSTIVETITKYSKNLKTMVYEEVHTTAMFSFSSPPTHVRLYIPYDGTEVTSMCGGMATRFNFTANFCASSAATGKALLSAAHLGDAETVGKFLGGKNFTSCASLMSTMTGDATRVAGPGPSFGMLGAGLAVVGATFVSAFLLF